LNQLLKYLLETPQTENLDAECTKFAIEAGEVCVNHHIYATFKLDVESGF
jgi:hypothetical protein